MLPNKKILAERTVQRNAGIDDWLERKFAEDEVVQAIRNGAGKKEHPINILRIWIHKIAQVTDSLDGTKTDVTAAEGARYKKITKESIARLFKRSPGWIRQCVEAGALMEVKQTSTNVDVVRYLNTEDTTEFGVKSFLDFLQQH
jgi:hypothetical protein